MTRKQDLQAIIRAEGLTPDPFNVGVFHKERPDEGDNGIRFLYPSWVFHRAITEKVLAGAYDEILPYTAEFVPTLNCSYRCRIPCSFTHQKRSLGVWEANDFENERVHMPSVEFAKQLVDRLWQGGIKGITFTGGGEPSSFGGLEDVMLHAHKRGLDTVLFTNGDWVDPQRIAGVLAASPKLVRISLNAGTKEVHTRFHHPFNPATAFMTVLDTIELFARGALQHPDVSVGLSVVINAINQNDLVETAQRVREIVDRTKGGIAFLAYRPMFNNRPCKIVDGTYRRQNQLSPGLLTQAYRTVEEQVRPILDGTGVRVSNVTSRYEALLHCQSVEYSRYYDSCRASGLFAELAPDGRLHLCCDWNCDPDFAIGDLTTSTLEEIWGGEQRRALIQRISDSKCEICPPACKPHDANRQFEQVERLRATGDLFKAEVWIEEQQMAAPPKMVNF